MNSLITRGCRVFLNLIADNTPFVANDPPCPSGRGSGRTQWMIDRLSEAIEDGQPYSIVVGQNWDQVVWHLRPRIIEKLLRRGIEPKSIPGGESLDCDGSIIHFSTPETIERDRCGVRAGEFWDHYPEELSLAAVVREYFAAPAPPKMKPPREFSQRFMSAIHAEDNRRLLYRLAMEHHERSEDYDRTICTGKRGAVAIPMTPEQRRLSTEFAMGLIDELVRRESKDGHFAVLLREEIRRTTREFEKSLVCNQAGKR